MATWIARDARALTTAVEMPSLFISYCHEDDAAVRDLCAALDRHGFRLPFLASDPVRGIKPGETWEPALYAQLRSTKVVLFAGTPAAVASRWCFAELAIARSLGKRVIPVRLADGGEHPLLSDKQAIDVRDAAGVEALCEQIARANPFPDIESEWDPSRVPYPGMRPFDDTFAAVFFGRDVEIQRLRELVESSAQRTAGRLIGVVGASGSGKSSLIRAGLMHRLRDLPEWVVLPVVEPGSEPLLAVARSVTNALRGQGHVVAVKAVLSDLEERGLSAFADDLCITGAPSGPATSVLLAIDRAEEILKAPPGDRRRFFKVLRDATSGDGVVWAVLALRSEFLDALLADAGAFDGDMLLAPLQRNRLSEVIARPAVRSAYTFEEGLVERIVDETGGGDAMPLLSYALEQLAMEAGPDRLLSFAAYERIGGVIGALHQAADRLHERHGATLVELLTMLVAVSPEGAVTGRRVARRSLSAAHEAVVDEVVAKGLVKTDRVDGQPTVEVTHEALLRQWGVLADTIEGQRGDLRMRSDVERMSAAWERDDRHDRHLPRDEQLDELLAWLQRSDTGSTDLGRVREFLAAARERQHERHRVSADVLAHRVLDGIREGPELGVLLARAAVQELAATPTALIALQSALDAPLSIRIPNGVWLDSCGWSPDGNALATGGDKGIVRIFDIPSGQFRTHLARSRGNDRATSVDWSADGRLIAAGTARGAVAIWDAASGKTVQELLDPEVHDEDEERGPAQVRWASTGRLAIGSANSGLWVWEPAAAGLRELSSGGIDALDWSPNGELIAFLEGGRLRMMRVADGHTLRLVDAPRARTVAWSPYGEFLAMGGSDGWIRVLETATGLLPQEVQASESRLVRVTWGSTDEYVAAADDESIGIWHVGTGLRVRTLGPVTSTLSDAAWSRAASRLSAVSGEGTIAVWQVAPPAPARVLQTHAGHVTAIAWPPSACSPIVGARDGTIRAWDAALRAYAPCLESHDLEVTLIHASPAGRWLATAGLDREVAIHDLAADEFLGWVRDVPQVVDAVPLADRRLVIVRADGCIVVLNTDPPSEERIALETPAEILAAGADGDRVRFAGARGPIALAWEWPGEEEPIALRGHRAAVLAAAFAPGARVLATGCADGHVRIWSLPAGQEILRLGEVGRAISALSWSPDGTRVAAAARDGGVRVWEVQHGHQLGVWPHRQAERVRFAWDPESAALATSEGDDSLRVWDVLDPAVLCDRASARVTRALSPDERRRYGLPEGDRGWTLARRPG